MSMSLKQLRTLEVGDDVQWTDPEEEHDSGTWTVIEIITESGLIEAEDSPLVLRHIDHSVVEVYANELL